MAFERLKNLVDVARNPKRYRNPDDRTVSIEDKTDPSSWRDETAPTWKDRLSSRKRQFQVFAYFLIVGTGLAAVYLNRFAPGLTGNVYLRNAIFLGVLIPLCVWIGTRMIRGKLEQVDWLVLLIPRDETEAGGLGFYVGNRTEDSDGNAVFEPFKGFSIMGLKGEKLTLGDLADDWQRQWAKQGRESTDQARIRIEEALYDDRNTFVGRITAVLTDGLDHDQFGQESDLVTKEPDIVDPERYRDLATSLSDLRTRLDQTETELDNVREDRDMWRERAKQREDEVRRRIVKTHSELAEAGMTPRGQRSPDQLPGEQLMNGGSE